MFDYYWVFFFNSNIKLLLLDVYGMKQYGSVDRPHSFQIKYEIVPQFWDFDWLFSKDLIW